MRNYYDANLFFVLKVFIFCVMIFLGIAGAVFEWRNPLCNSMAFFRHFPSVIKFERLPQFQYEK
jgi:hypothetical protein